MKKIKIIFFGTPEFSATILESMISDQWLMVKAVVTQPDKPVGREQILTPSPVKTLAQRHKIPVFDYTDPTTILGNIVKKKPDLIIVAAFGEILPPEILQTPRFGCLGVHPSLLPKYRGPTPIQFAILNGERETGVTIFLMDRGTDRGPIISNIKYQISNIKITYKELSEELAKLGSKLLIETVPKWIGGEIKPKLQDHKKATYTKLLTKKDGFVEWKKVIKATQEGGGGAKIDRMIRALTPWPGVWTKINIKNQKSCLPDGRRAGTAKIKNKRLKILKAHLEKGRLVLDQVQLEGKKPISWGEFVRGHPNFSLIEPETDL